MRRYIGEGCGRGHKGAGQGRSGLTPAALAHNSPGSVGPVAQSVEQLTFNQWVTGSNPVGLTKTQGRASGPVAQW